ncbi:CDK5 and ABL1 enzyme substrate 1 [Mortierella polycephala]|uniref:CDK5 and ABL1 enzyme substrate 1 n=1 Tax=Mortierella polycephala TaxID=41804 RepID=A0A9P6PT32_9FUNG|nr:CDK5 and ABL1 enzyme substrate 1 [Mortierella polycephala]
MEPTPNANVNSGARNVRRRANERQAAFSFLSSIQLDPSIPAAERQLELTLEDSPHRTQGQDSTSSLPQGSMDNIDAGEPPQTLNSSVPVTPTEERTPHIEIKRTHHNRKEEMATTFLSGLSLRGESGADPERPPNAESQEFKLTPNHGGKNNEINVPWEAQQTPTSGIPSHRRNDLHPSVQRSSSTPSLASSFELDPGGNTTDSVDSTHTKRNRNRRGTGLFALRDLQQANNRTSKHIPPSKEPSSGLLSTLLARERGPDTFVSSEMGSSPSYRHALQKTQNRWLGPLADHVHIKPFIASGTNHIVKRIFKRPSIGSSKHVISHSQSAGSLERQAAAKQYPLRTNSHNITQQMQPPDDRRHIFYMGADMTNSCMSLGENLSQHAFMFTTKRGSPLVVSSILRYNDDKAPNKRRRRRFDREYLQQITKEALIRKKANSFAHLLTQSNALDPETQDSSSYDPYYLDDPELKTGKNRTVISLACYMGSVIQYTRPSDLKRELNEHFRSRHPDIDPSITLSKIRKIKSDLLVISEELDLEISTAALAYAYFEKLILKGTWTGKEGNSLSAESSSSPVTKENRKLMACVCLLLAYKVNEPKRPPGEFSVLMKQMTKHMDVAVKDIKEHEFQVFSLLDFNLYLPRQEFLPHFEQILYRQDYINVQEYLGEDEFYSVSPQVRKTVE